MVQVLGRYWRLRSAEVLGQFLDTMDMNHSASFTLRSTSASDARIAAATLRSAWIPAARTQPSPEGHCCSCTCGLQSNRSERTSLSGNAIFYF